MSAATTGRRANETGDEHRTPRSGIARFLSHYITLFSPYSPYAIALFCVSSLVYFAIAHSTVEVEHGVAVIKVYAHSPNRFQFQHVDSNNHPYGRAFTEDICNDYPLPSGDPGGDFEQGIILEDMYYRVKGSCWSLNPNEHCGYYARYDDTGKPIFLEVAKRYGNRN